MKRSLKKYGFGDEVGDPTKPKNARKVDTVPQGYIPLDGVENYYHNPLANKQTLDKATPTFGKQGGDAYNKKIIDMLGQGHTIDDLVNNKYGTKEGLEPFKSYYKQSADDFVYIDPKTKQPDYMTKNMSDRVYYPNKQAAGDYSFNVLKGDVTNPQSNSSTVSYRPIDKLGKPTGDYYDGIPSGEWTNALGGNEGFTDDKLKAWSKYKVSPTAKMATGGKVGSNSDMWSGLIKQAPELLDSLMGLLDNNSYSRQPIVNASTIKNMATPYNNSNNMMAFGGSIEDLDEDQLAQLQDEADSQGITIEEAFDNMNQDQGDQSQDEETAQDQADPNDEQDSNGSLLDKYTSDNGEFAYGGRTHRNVEVEGQEVIQTPDGQVGKVQGPSHEEGGVDMAVPEGSDVFSKRLKIEGKSMAVRKLNREKQLSKIKGLMDKDPHNQLLKNTQARTIETLGNEDNQDMMLQKVASKIYAPPQENAHPEKKYAYGDTVGNPIEDYLNSLNGTQPNPSARVPYPIPSTVSGIPMTRFNPSIANSTNPVTAPSGYPAWNKPAATPSNPDLMGEHMTAGDYVGMAGTAFGAIAPIINTMNNRRATKPNINRFTDFGHNALEDNNTAQDYVAGVKSNEMSNIDTSANTSYARNSNGASSINTLRALDAGTDTQVAKSRRGVSDSFSKAMMSILGQRSQLDNIRDYRVAAGQSQADTENKADTDNYYSNMAANLGNLGTGVQTIGRDLNISHGNKVDANLISQLSRYGLEFDEKGNLITKR